MFEILSKIKDNTKMATIEQGQIRVESASVTRSIGRAGISERLYGIGIFATLTCSSATMLGHWWRNGLSNEVLPEALGLGMVVAAGVATAETAIQYIRINSQ